MTARRRHKEVKGKISYLYGIIFIALMVAFYWAIVAIDGSLPTPLEVSDESENPDSFIAERARDFLRPLVDIGPRVVGYKSNEELAVNYLKQQIETIIENAHGNQKITYDVQVQSGSFFVDFKPNGAINVYENIQNVVVKVHSEKESPYSVLVNTHFDTVPNSPGGSDDGINVAVALEVIRKLFGMSQRPTHNIIFLFNGAEEAALCGSHAFLIGHPLAKEVRVFVNLESVGAGGKEILFQTGPNEPWLLKYYNDVPHPHANSGAEEVFQSNLIPSDTDFRIFRDYGEMVGYDFSFYKDGYRYHTKYDGVDNIDYGSFQHIGDNVLKLVRNLAEAPELAHPKTGEGKTVYFDVFGLFFLHYSMETNAIFNSFLVLISVLLMIWASCSLKLGKLKESTIYITLLIFVTVLGWFIASSIVLITASILDVTHQSMTWYSTTALIFLLYVAPTCASMLITTVILNKVIRHKKITLSSKVLLQVHVTRLIWTVILLVFTIVGLRIAIMFVFGVLFNSIAMLIVHTLYLWKPRLTIKIWSIIYIISTMIPTTIVYLYAYEDIALFAPIFGRMGGGMNPDLLMALIVSSFTISIGSYYIPLFTYIKKPWYVIMVLAACFFAGIILAYTPVGSPYNKSPRFQRYSIYHTKRVIKDDFNNVIKSDSGFYFPKNDRNTPHSLKGHVTFLSKEKSLEDDCEIAPGCGVPITNSRGIKNVEDGVWIPSESPPFDTDIDYTWTKADISPTKRKYSVEVTGSNKIDVYLSIRKGFTLKDLSLVDEVPKSYVDWNDQVTYYISFVYGRTPAALKFSFTIETSSDWSSPSADLAITTKFVHDDLDAKTVEYKEFLDEFPSWAVITVSGLAQYENVLLFTYIKKPWYVIMVLAACFFAGIILAYTPVGSLYNKSPRFQRYSIYGAIKDDFNNVIKSDSGFYFPRNDRNTPHSLKEHVTFLSKEKSLEDDCEIAPGCGVPITNSRGIKNVEDGVWIPSESPPFDTDIDYTWTKADISSMKRKYSVEVTGSNKIDMYLSIRKGFTLKDLSLVDEVPKSYVEWNDQVTYYISFVYGRTPAALKFSFTIETSYDWSSPSADLAIITKFVHDDLDAKTVEYKEFLHEFPSWAVITVSGLGQYENVILT